MRHLLNLLFLGCVHSWEVDELCVRRRHLSSDLWEIEHIKEESEGALAGDRVLQANYEDALSDPAYLAENNFRFNLKMYWEAGFCWQEEWIERRWCMECDGNNGCNEGDILEVQECDNIEVQEFTWIPVPNTGGGRLKVYSKDLCFERISTNRFQLRECSASIKQIHIGFDPTKPFELHPYGNEEKCFTQQHHPKSFEEIYTTSCTLARSSNTNQWQVIWAEGSYDGVGYVFDGKRNPTHLRSASCSQNNPCQPCEGDCDSNKECAGKFKCYQRGKSNQFGKIPGCDGLGRSRDDYCYDPSAPPPPALDEIDLVRPIRLCRNPGTICRECEGDCNEDDDCEGTLVCFQKTGYAPVPGCKGRDDSRTDYCVDPAKLAA